MMMKNRRGILFSLLFHAVVGVFLALFGFTTPLPLPEEEGILVNFGEDEFAAGSDEPDIQPRNVMPEPSEPEPSSSDASEDILTQDFEETAALDDGGTDQVTEDETQETTQDRLEPRETQQQQESTEEEVEEEPEVNPLALYRRNTKQNQDNSEGITEGEGNQGSPTGSELSDDYTHALSTGTGNISYSLNGRNPLLLPKPDYDYQVEGKVVVEVVVDRNGNVLSASPGVKGSTTLNEYLLSVAKKAALKAKFDNKPDAPVRQKGTITYFFKLE